jgi:tetratricopeptide (TPR) repeat protein
MIYGMIQSAMSETKNQHQVLIASLMLIEAENLETTVVDTLARECCDLVVLSLFRQYKDLIDSKLAYEIREYIPTFNEESMNSSNFRASLFLKLAGSLLRFQLEELHNSENYTQVIQSLIEEGKIYLFLLERTDPVELESIRKAIISLESRNYELRNHLTDNLRLVEESIVFFSKSLASLEGNSLLYGYVLVAKASAYQKLGDFKLAIEDYSKALFVFTRVDHPDKWAQIKLSLGVCLEAVGGGFLKEAIEHYEFALTVFNSVFDPFRTLQCCFGLARCYGAILKEDSSPVNLQKMVYYFGLVSNNPCLTSQE